MKHILLKILIMSSFLHCSFFLSVTHAKTIKPFKKREINTITTETDLTKERTIMVTNTITAQDASWSFLGITYTPELRCSINDIPIKEHQQLEIPVPKDELLIVRYDYSYAGGYRIGAKKVILELDEPCREKINLEFSWKNKYRVFAQGTRSVSIEKADPNPQLFAK